MDDRDLSLDGDDPERTIEFVHSISHTHTHYHFDIDYEHNHSHDHTGRHNHHNPSDHNADPCGCSG